MPQLFPKGPWQVTGVYDHAETEPYLYPYYFATDAWQMVESWGLDNGGGYDKPSGVFVRDAAYGLHHAGQSMTTLGCLNLYHGYSQKEMLDGMNWLKSAFLEVIFSGRRVSLIAIS